MAKFIVWAATSRMGSQVEKTVEIDDAKIEGMQDDEIWDAYLQDELRDLVQSGFQRAQINYCTNCMHWETADENENSAPRQICKNSNGPLFGNHVTAMESCEGFESLSSD